MLLSLLDHDFLKATPSVPFSTLYAAFMRSKIEFLQSLSFNGRTVTSMGNKTGCDILIIETNASLGKISL